MKKISGAVSIFMIIITLSCFMLGGIFIDGARILSAKNKVRLSMEAAARSAMSYYDEDLKSEYGLYGVEKDKLNEEFKKYFKANLTKNGYKGINLFKFEINSKETKMKATTKLGAGMEDQILEYEKYRMPVMTTMVLVNKISGPIKDLFGMTDKADKANKSVKKFENKWSYAQSTIKNSKDAIKGNIFDSFKSDIKTALVDVTSKSASTVIESLNKTTDTRFGEIRSEIDKMKKELEGLKKQKKEFESEKSSYAADKSEVPIDADADGKGEEYEANADKVSTKVDSAEEQYDDAEAKIDAQIKKLEKDIKELETSVQDVEDRLDTAKSELHTLLNKYKDIEKSLDDAKAERKKIAEQLKVAEDEAKVKTYNNDIYKINSGIKKLLSNDEIKEDCELYKECINKDDPEDEDVEIIEEIEKKYKDKKEWEEIFVPVNEIKKIQDEIEALQKTIKTKKEKLKVYDDKITYWNDELANCKKDIENKNTEISDIVNEIGDFPEPKLGDKLVDDLKESAKDILDGDGLIGQVKNLFTQFGATMPEIDDSEVDVENEKGLLNALEGIVSDFKNLYNVVTNLEGMRNQAMFIDYIMGKCTYLTNQNEKGHYFNFGEVEYILYGNKSQMVNIGRTLIGIYALRFPINAINYFATTHTGIFSRIAIAITRGAVQSLLDIGDMIIAVDGDSAEGCAICPSFKEIKLSYSDHLRLLLLMKFNKENDMKNLEETINSTLVKCKDATGTGSLYTAGTANVKVNVNLIMVPHFTNLLPNAMNFKDGKYIIENNMNISY